MSRRGGAKLRLKPEGLRDLVNDLSESWGLLAWDEGEELLIRPPMDDQLREEGYLIVTLTKGQRERLTSRLALASLGERYGAAKVTT